MRWLVYFVAGFGSVFCIFWLEWWTGIAYEHGFDGLATAVGAFLPILVLVSVVLHLVPAQTPPIEADDDQAV